MGKRIFLYVIFLCLSQNIFAQPKLTYKAYFDYNNSYCPGDSQYDQWVDFITSLDTNTDKYLRITMRGTYDMAGKSCSDKYAVRQIADALYNRYDASVYCDGNYWSVGTGCSDFNCGSYSDYMELTLNSSTCNCGVSYTIRPAITSQNWGGIGTETCQSWAQNASQDMQVDMQRIYGNDNLSVASVVPFDECANAQPLRVNISNNGVNKVSSYRIGYIINGVLQTPVSVSTAIQSDAISRITLVGTYNLVPNRAYTFKIWTYDPNSSADADPSDDTLVFAYTHTGIPAIPSANKVINCGQGRVNIAATSNDSVLWYDRPSSGQILFMGENFTTPWLQGTDTFYAEAVKFKHVSSAFGTGFNNYTTLSYDQSEYNGGFFKLSPKDLLHVSGIRVQSLFGNTTPHYKVYVREGGFAGYERDSTEWKRVFDAELPNGGNINTIPLELILQPNTDYGLYVTTDPLSGEDIWMNFGSYNYTNADISVEGGAAAYGKFGRIGIYTPWTIDMELVYEKTCKSSGRQAVPVIINPRPDGSELLTAPGYKGHKHLGVSSDPDVSEPGMLLGYMLTNPSGYNNKDYNSTWLVDDIGLLTSAGIQVSKSMYSFTDPDASANGELIFVPDSTLIDSTIEIRIRVRDMGPYFCDTIITRFIHIAPIPKPGFKVLSTICEGSEVYFNNLSTIHSGRMSYMWYFSPTDSSDFFEPIHRFDSFGVFPVKLVVTSEPYHIRRDTTFMVNINSVPDVDFTISNACEGGAVVFTNATKGNLSLITFKWDFGDQTPLSPLLNPVHTYAVPNGYKVMLKADLNGCSDTMTKNAYLFPEPVARFSAPVVPMCQSDSLYFTNQSSIYKGKMGALWSFGDGQYSTLKDVHYKFSQPGSYNVKLKMISEFECADSIVRPVEIKAVPVVDFGYDRLCSRDSTHFYNKSTEFAGIISNYTWSFSEGPDQHAKSIARKWSSHGPKTVKLVSELSNGCIGEMERELDVLIEPEANFRVFDICSGESAVFVNLSQVSQGEMAFLWDFGDSTLTTDAANAQHIYNSAKTRIYMASLIVSVDGGCSDTVKKPVKVNELPHCGFTIAPFSQVGNKAFKFTPENSSYDEYEWFFGDGGASKSKSPIYQYLYEGSYLVKLRAKNTAGCECEQSFKLKFDATGVRDNYTDIFNVYPNPAGRSVHIQFTGTGKATANIYNYIGEIIMTIALENDLTEIITAEWSSGLYMIEVMQDGKRSVASINVLH